MIFIKGLKTTFLLFAGEYDSDANNSGDDHTKNSISYQSNFDFGYYNDLLQREQAKEEVANSHGERTDPCGSQGSLNGENIDDTTNVTKKERVGFDTKTKNIASSRELKKPGSVITNDVKSQLVGITCYCTAI